MADAGRSVTLTIPQLVRFWAKVEKTDECWNWMGRMSGEGKRTALVYVNGRTYTARRLVWEQVNEPLHPKIKLVTKCHNVRCVNPEHMVPRYGGGTLPVEECRRGHKLEESNVYITSQGKRACRECIKLTSKARRKRYLKEGRGWGRTYRVPKSTKGRV